MVPANKIGEARRTQNTKSKIGIVGIVKRETKDKWKMSQSNHITMN